MKKMKNWNDAKEKYEIITDKSPEVGDTVFVQGSGIFTVVAIKKRTMVQVKDEKGYGFFLPPSYYKLVKERG
jgi:hypothetical protein